MTRTSPALAAALAVAAVIGTAAPAHASTVWPPPGAIPPGTQIEFSLTADDWAVSAQRSGCSSMGLTAGQLFYGGINWGSSEGAVDFVPNEDIPDPMPSPGTLTLPRMELYPGYDSAGGVYIQVSVALRCETTPGRFATERDGYVSFGLWSVIPGATLPPRPGGGGPGGGPGPLPEPACPAAEKLLTKARIWNEMAQRMRGLSVESHQALIKQWDVAAKALVEMLWDTATNPISDGALNATEKAMVRKIFEGYDQLWQHSFDKAKFNELVRQLERLKDMKKFVKALGPITKLDSALKAAGALWEFGGASYHATLRNSADYFGKDFLAKADALQKQAKTACGSAARAGAAVAARPAKRKPAYSKLARPRSVRGFRVEPGLGLSAKVARSLNGLLSGQDRSLALAKAIRESLARSAAARKARSARWEGRQLKNARATARKLAAQLEAQVRLRRRVAGTLRGPAAEPTGFEIVDPRGLAGVIRRLGVLDRPGAKLKRLGVAPGELSRHLAGLPAGAHEVPSLAAALSDPAALDRDRAWAAALRAFAAG